MKCRVLPVIAAIAYGLLSNLALAERAAFDPFEALLLEELPPEAPKADRPALRQALEIARTASPRDNLAQRYLDLLTLPAPEEVLCIGAAKDFGKDLKAAPKLADWGVRRIQNFCHVANLLTSPITGVHYYIENNIAITIVVMRETTCSDPRKGEVCHTPEHGQPTLWHTCPFDPLDSEWFPLPAPGDRPPG